MSNQTEHLILANGNLVSRPFFEYVHNHVKEVLSTLSRDELYRPETVLGTQFMREVNNEYRELAIGCLLHSADLVIVPTILTGRNHTREYDTYRRR